MVFLSLPFYVFLFLDFDALGLFSRLKHIHATLSKALTHQQK